MKAEFPFMIAFKPVSSLEIDKTTLYKNEKCKSQY